ncbi:MAG: glycosyltransferase [Myxococcota bacterium]
MIQVLHVLCDYNVGGAEKFVFRLCQAYPPHIYPKVCTVYRGGPLEDDFRTLGIPLLCCDRKRRRLSLNSNLKLARWISESDIVHTHLFAGHFWGRIGAQLASLSSNSKPVISTIHNTNPDSMFRAWLLRQTESFSDIQVGISQTVTQILPPGSETIYSGIDLALFSEINRRPIRGRIVSIGRLVEQKGFDVLGEATRLLLQIDPSIQVDVIGEGPQLDNLLGYGLNLLGHRKDIRTELESADIFVLPTRWEGLGLVLLEAMAAGVPIITSDIPICREICGSAAVYVPVNQPVQLAEQIIELVNDYSKKQKMRSIGIERSKMFSIEQAAERYTRLYEKLLKSTD